MQFFLVIPQFFFNMQKYLIHNKKPFCVPINFDNPLKACFSNKKYPVTIQTRPAQILTEYFF